MTRALVRHKASGEYTVVDMEEGVCSDTLHYSDLAHDLQDYHLDNELADDYDPEDFVPA